MPRAMPMPLISVVPRLWRKTLDAAAARFPSTIAREVAEAQSTGWTIESQDAACHRCGVTMGPGSVRPEGCALCIGRRLAWRSVTRLGAYNEPMSRWIVMMKFAGAWSWSRWFGEQLASRMPDSPSDRPTVVCPVPMHWLRRWRRGYNQAALIAAAVARDRAVPMVHLLRRNRHTPPQTTVAPSNRRGNVRGSIVARPIDLTGWDVWLVDDVMTTGATLTECARALRRAGAASVSLAVVAVADPPQAGRVVRHDD